MPDTGVIDEYLRLTLVPADDQGDVDKLYESAQALHNSLIQDKKRTIRYTLTAIDPTVSPDDPTITEAAGEVQKNWKYFNNKYGAVAVSIYRALLANALQDAVADNESIAAAIYLTASNVFPYMNLGAEAPIFFRLIQLAAMKTEAAAVKTMSTKTTKSQLKYVPTDPAALIEPLRDALGAQTVKDGQQVPPSNPMNINNIQPWAENAAQRTAAAIAKAITDSANGNADQVANHLARRGSLVPIQTRLDLLWWKEALYSPTANQSYRSLHASVAAVMMAIDLSAICPAYIPESTQYMLREAMWSAFGHEPSVTSLSKHFSRIAASESRLQIASGLKSESDSRGRLDIAQAIRLATTSTLPPIDNIASRVGIPHDTEVSATELAVMAFRCIQAAKALEA